MENTPPPVKLKEQFPTVEFLLAGVVVLMYVVGVLLGAWFG